MIEWSPLYIVILAALQQWWFMQFWNKSTSESGIVQNIEIIKQIVANQDHTLSHGCSILTIFALQHYNFNGQRVYCAYEHFKYDYLNIYRS